MRIAIVGGSLGGLFAAALLQQAGHTVHVYERSRA
ncbi:NAD(P)-binding protein, partial [Listeria monocytogenes]|nr:NAD(P)-binding protein [Listeria monocytogenes]